MDLPNRELIEDREVAKFDDDRLGHGEIADQLAELVSSVPTPSNVALYGPWGSGKSGIGNLLASRLAAKPDVKFARFDAFKYAENPLRRSFVSVVASALGISDSRFHHDLYSGRTTTDFTVPFRKLVHLLLIFASVVLVCVLVASVAVSAVAAVQGKDPLAELLSIGLGTLPASLVPASLLTAVIALVGKTFVVEKRVDRAESDEEFEELLRQLVRKADATRVVIFVDELDRCSSDDVVGTLNAVRTFLGVDKCVFVVAADQQVLERALTQSLAQPTPVDTLNPYYSAGSAYLDKVFQYQVSVPPLMPQSVTSFAAKLIEKRPGVWQKIDSQVVASILIPTHVRSPRRVKNLLNAFVLTYRLAESRRESGQLDLDVLACVDELARLVCLRVEFPLFARDLVTDPNLSDYVRELADTGTPSEVWDKYKYVEAETRAIAEGYANTERAVDKLLVEGADDEPEEEELRKVQGKQLLDYLSRTRHVRGPTKALIFLQNSGTLFGLAAPVAEQLERDAQNAALASLGQTFEGLDPAARGAAIDLLVQQARAAVGLELPNVARSILSLAAADASALDTRADEVSSIVASAASQDSRVISEETVVGAWQLAIAGSRPESKVLGRLVAESSFVETDSSLLDLFIRDGIRTVDFLGSKAAALLADALFQRDPVEVVDRLLDTDEPNRAALLGVATGELSTRLREAITAFESTQKEEQEAAAAATAARRVRPAAPPVQEREAGEEAWDPTPLLTELDRLISGLGQAASAEVVVRALLATNTREGRSLVESHLGSVAITEPITMRLIAEHARRRSVSLWPKWLGRLPPSALAQPAVDTALLALVKQLWNESLAATPASDSDLRTGADALAGLLDNADEKLMARIYAAALQLGEPVVAEEQIRDQERRAHVAKLLVACGVARGQDVATEIAKLLVASLESKLGEQPTGSALAEYVIDSVENALLQTDELRIEGTERVTLIRAVADTGWLSEFDQSRLVVIARTLAGADVDTSALEDIPASTVAIYEPDLSEIAYEQLLIYWLRSTTESASDVLALVHERLLADPSDGLLSATRFWSEGLATVDLYLVVSAFVSDASTEVPETKVLEAIGLSRLPAQNLVSLLIDRYKDATSNAERRRVLDLWRTAQPADQQARRQLIREILIPFVGLNAQATGYALGYLNNLAYPLPTGTKKALGDAVLAAIRGSKGLEGRGLHVLESLGYPVTRKGFLGLRKEVNTDENS